MSETPKKVNLDAALRQWPDLEKSPVELDNTARQIDEHLRSGQPGATAAYVADEILFAAPLGQIHGEGHNSAEVAAPRVNAGETRVSKDPKMSMHADRERDRRSLQDLAKMAEKPGSLTPPPPSVKPPPVSSPPSGMQRAAEAQQDDSGVIDLAMAAQADPQAAARAQSTPLANAGLFDDEPASAQGGAGQPLLQAPASQHVARSSPPSAGAPSSPPASLGQAPVSAAPASFAPAPSAATSPSQGPIPMTATTATKTNKGSNGPVIALVACGVIALGSLAAGGLFWFKNRSNDQYVKGPALVMPTVPTVPTIAKPAEPPPAEPATAAEPAPDPSAKLAVAPKPTKGAAKNAPTKEESAKLSAKDLAGPAAAADGDLNAAMGKAVGADGKPVEATPAAGNTGPQFAAGTVPQKPSQGAITGALGSVLPGARACLGPDDPVSRASVTFVSTGTVQSVNVSGGAAGKPAEACIKAALIKAKVAPFAESTFTANVTVRH